MLVEKNAVIYTETMIIVSQLKPLTTLSDQTNQVIFRIQVEEQNFDIYIKSASIIKQPGLEPAVPLALLPAMRLKQPIHVKGPVSRTFIEGIKRVIRFYASNFDEFSDVAITSDSSYQAQTEKLERKACFFSGGVDSFYTLLKTEGMISDIVTIRGFDMSLSDPDRWEKTKESGAAIANELGIEFHEVETNAGTIIKKFGSWLTHGHGLALACVARSLAGRFSQVSVASSASLNEQIPWGSSAFTDPEYSDERLSIIHDADNANRVDKITFLANKPIALKYMRVCPGIKNDGKYNCCRCSKCLRTMVTLYALGVLDQASTFPLPLTPKLVANSLLESEAHRIFAKENLLLMSATPSADQEMLRALQVQLKRPIWLSGVLIKLRRKRRHLNNNLKKIKLRIAGLS